MFDAIKYNLANLVNFKGREGRSDFWFYILFLTIIQIAISFLISIAMTGPMMGDVFTAAQQGASEAQMQSQIFDRLADMMRLSAWASAISSLVMTGLVVASFTRRLHDSNKPGWIAIAAAAIQLIAVVLQIGSIDEAVRVIAMAQTGNVAQIQEAQGALILNGLVAWVPAFIVLVFGVWPSTDGANRYGSQPDHL